MNYLLLMDAASDAQAFCDKFSLLFTIAGYAVFIIKVIVPIILIITGMLTLAKAVTTGDEKKTKEAQGILIKKVVYAVSVFLVIQIVGIIMGLVSSSQAYKTCGKCVFSPFSTGCEFIQPTSDFGN